MQHRCVLLYYRVVSFSACPLQRSTGIACSVRVYMLRHVVFVYCMYTKSIIYYGYLVICVPFDFLPSILTTHVCVCGSAVWCNVVNTLGIIRPTTTTLVNRPRIDVLYELSADKFGLETTENRFGRHKALAERIGRTNVRGFGSGNENGVKRRVPIFSENIIYRYITKRFKELCAIVSVYLSSVFQFV